MNKKYVIIGLVALVLILAGALAYTLHSRNQESTETSTTEKETEQQRGMRLFLEADKKYGAEASEYTNKTGIEPTSAERERVAYNRLIGQFKQLDCSALPNDFCTAYDTHLQDWQKLVDFMNREYDRSAGLSDSILLTPEYIELEKIVDGSYDKVLEVAHRYDVEFAE